MESDNITSDSSGLTNHTTESDVLFLRCFTCGMMFAKFGKKRVCIDGTHGTNANTIMVVDEFGSGFPVAWCLSNHEDTTFMSIFC